ncbi:unnamed protein product [Prorocentrum cordatum]|uniref:C3H1-type domain-containing protein n=1 Tax=Prorocentrum cordatum TaxID=2364126 RepID=A0ABN9WCJ5_9DINO|nr:unnamed protein product [Polarella glacialis]
MARPAGQPVARDRPCSAGAAGALHEGETFDALRRPSGLAGHHGAPAGAPAAATHPRAQLPLALLAPPPGLAQPPTAGASGSVATPAPSDSGGACERCGQQEMLHRCGHWRCVTPTCRPAWFQDMEAKSWLVPRSLERMLDAHLFETLDRCEDCRPEGRCLRADAGAPRYCNFVFKRGTCKFGSKCPDCHLHGRRVTHHDCSAYPRPQAHCTRDRAPDPGRGPALVGGAVECAQLPCTPPPEDLEA